MTAESASRRGHRRNNASPTGMPLDNPGEDPKTCAMPCRAESTGVFQVKSRARKSMLAGLPPRTFCDRVIEVAIVAGTSRQSEAAQACSP